MKVTWLIEDLDARFEVLGAPFSLLSVQLSPSQNLYTRRGTLVALSGKAENVFLSNTQERDWGICLLIWDRQFPRFRFWRH